MLLPKWAEQREYQEEAVDDIIRAFNLCSHVFLDAPTGSGKTLIAYLVGRELRYRTIYLCTSISLQSQFVHDFPSAALLKGRSNYPTLDRPELYHSKLHISCADCTKTPANQSCLYCFPISSCPYERAKAVAAKSDLVCTNTAYFLTEQNYVGRLVPKPAKTLVVIDECDTLETLLSNFIELRVTERAQHKYAIRPPKHKTVLNSWIEWSKTTTPHIDWWIDKVLTQLDGTHGDLQVALSRDLQYLRNLQRSLELLNSDSEGLASGNWIFTEYQSNNIVFKPVKVNTLTYDYLWRHAEKFLMMSGTIISSEVMAESLGIT